MNDKLFRPRFSWQKIGFTFLAVLVLLSLADNARATVCVDVNATGASYLPPCWQAAYTSLQAALDATENDEIWVAAGVYTPAGPNGDRNATFELKSGVALYGGFAGNETDFDQRDPVANPTILSGDLDNDDVTRWVNGHFSWLYSANNSIHVVTAENTDATAVIDGFEIGHGYAYGSPNGFYGTTGGGLLILNASPTLNNVTFTGNGAQQGGAVAVHNGSPVVTNSVFYRNYADIGEGGAVYTDGTSDAAFTVCTFSENTAIGSDITEGLGGAIFNTVNGTLSVAGSTFIGNRTGYRTYSSADDYQTRGGAIATYGATVIEGSQFLDNASHLGGAIYSYRNLDLVNSIFSGNAAINTRWVGLGPTGLGGALITFGDTRLINVTVSGNTSTDNGAGIYSAGTTVVANSILWGNNVTNWIAPDEDPIPTVKMQLHKGAGTLDIRYSDIEGLFEPIPGEDPPDPANFPGSIDLDPLFVNAQGSDGRFGTEDDNLRLSAGSPAIDAGDNTAVAGITTDPDGNPRFSDDIDTLDTGNGTAPIVDMGAYEFVGLSTDPGDQQAPAVSLSSPGDGETVSGTLTFVADASDNVAIHQVSFFVDGQIVASTSAPYTFNWDSTSVANGTHAIEAKAYDGTGNVGASAVIAVHVNNAVSSGSGIPQTSPNAEEVNFKGTIDGVDANFLVISGSTVYYTDETLITFEDGTGDAFAVGQQTEVVGMQNPDGIVMATEIQVAP